MRTPSKNREKRTPNREVDIGRFTHAERETIIWGSTCSSSETLILLAMNAYVDSEGFSWPGMDTLATACKMNRSTVLRNLNSLKEKGMLYKDPIFCPDTRRQTTNDLIVDFARIQEISELDRKIGSEGGVQNAEGGSAKCRGGGVQNAEGGSAKCRGGGVQNAEGEVGILHTSEVGILPTLEPHIEPNRSEPIDLNPHDPDACVRDRESEQAGQNRLVALQVKTEISRTVESPIVETPIPPPISPTNKYDVAFTNRSSLSRQDYFQIWYVLYKKALIQDGRSAEPARVAHQGWLNRFPDPIPSREIQGGLQPKFAAANPDLLEPIEEFVERVRLACGDEVADFVLGDHWHRLRIHHASLKTKSERDEFCAKFDFGFGEPVRGIKGMRTYLESLDAESSLEWVQMARERKFAKVATLDDRLAQYFDS